MATDYGQMEFQVRRNILRELAEQAATAVPTRETLPVLGCFRVTVGPDGLVLSATDMQRTVWASTAAVRRTGDAEGMVFLPAKRLRSILGKAPEGDVTVSVSGKAAKVAAGGTSWDCILPPPGGYVEGIDPADVGFSPVPRNALLTALKTVRHAVCRDAARPAYTQVKIAKDGDGMFAWGTDSSQFSRAAVAGFPFETCIPAAMLDDLIKLLAAEPGEEVGAADDGRQVLFRVGPVILACLRMGKDFPDMGALMMEPTAGYGATLGVDKAELVAAVERVAINASGKTSALGLIAEGGRLTVSARDDAGNKAQETVAATWSQPRRLIVLNWHHLIAMLDAHPAASCVFRLGEDKGKVRSKVRLDDPETGVIGVAPQMIPTQVGY